MFRKICIHLDREGEWSSIHGDKLTISESQLRVWKFFVRESCNSFVHFKLSQNKASFQSVPGDCLQTDQTDPTCSLGPWIMDLCFVCVPWSLCQGSLSHTHKKQSHPPHPLHFPNTLWPLSIGMIGCVGNQSDLEIPLPLLPGPRGREVGCCSHHQPSHGPWASWCKWLVNWGLQGYLEIGHRFLKAKLSSRGWLGLTITFQSCCM